MFYSQKSDTSWTDLVHRIKFHFIALTFFWSFLEYKGVPKVWIHRQIIIKKSSINNENLPITLLFTICVQTEFHILFPRETHDI